MSIPTRDEIRAGLKRIKGLSSAVQTILPRLGDENLSAHALGRMVAQDPILAARVLHLANSPFYGLSRQVASLDEAVLVLGISHLRGMVLTSGLISVFADRDAVGQSLATAAAAASLARSFHEDAGTALTAGLLHNLGGLLLGHFAEEQWAALARDVHPQSGDRLERERALFGFDHCELGADLARDWHFPEALCAAIRAHTRPSNAPQALVDVVHVAWVLGAVRPLDADFAFDHGTATRLALESDTGSAAIAAASQAVQDSRHSLEVL